MFLDFSKLFIENEDKKIFHREKLKLGFAIFQQNLQHLDLKEKLEFLKHLEDDYNFEAAICKSIKDNLMRLSKSIIPIKYLATYTEIFVERKKEQLFDQECERLSKISL